MSDRVLCEVLPPMLADKGGEFLLASSPNGRRSAFYRLYALGASPGPPSGAEADGGGVSYQGFQCPTADNGAPGRGVARVAAGRDGRAAVRAGVRGKFIDDFGMVFREEDIEAALADLPDARLTSDRTGVESRPDAGRLLRRRH